MFPICQKENITVFLHSEEKYLSTKIVFDIMVPNDSLATIYSRTTYMMIFPYFSLIALQDFFKDRNLDTVGICPKFGTRLLVSEFVLLTFDLYSAKE